MKQEIPPAAREVLAHKAVAGEHPSADLLNGFVEQALPGAERELVTLHLAGCAECREVVFLAGAAAEEQHRAPEIASSPRRFAWPSWKWLAPAFAAMALVTGVVVERMQTTPPAQHDASPTVAMNSPSVSPAIDRDELKANVPQPSTPPSEARPAQAKKSKDETRQSRDLSLSAEAAAGKNGEAAHVASLPPPRRSTVDTTSAAQPMASATQTAEVTNEPAPPPQAKSAAPTNAASMQKSADAIAPLGAPAAATPAKPVLAGAAPKDSGSGGGIGGGSVVGGSLARQKALSAPHWRISDDGHLERSAASGDWTRVLADQPVTFRTVAVIGGEVWAGGSDGALFHSTDGGNQWSRIPLIDGGRAEHGAVNSIRFATLSEGRVTTEDGATWSTTNGGKTWSKQY